MFILDHEASDFVRSALFPFAASLHRCNQLTLSLSDSITKEGTFTVRCSIRLSGMAIEYSHSCLKFTDMFRSVVIGAPSFIKIR